jgi:hypothetical protein
LTAKEAPAVKEKMDALPEGATKTDKFKVGVKGYAPAGAAAAVSFASIILSVMIGEHDKAVTAAAGAAAQIAAAKYQQALEKQGGKEAVEKVEQDINRECAADKQVAKPLRVIATGKGDDLFFDPLSGRTFTSSREEIEKAAIRLNKKIFNSIWMSVNEWYEELNLCDVVSVLDGVVNKGDLLLQNFAYHLVLSARLAIGVVEVLGRLTTVPYLHLAVDFPCDNRLVERKLV